MYHYMWSLILSEMGQPVLSLMGVSDLYRALRENFVHIPVEYRRRLAHPLLKHDYAPFLASVTAEERREAIRWRLYESDWVDGRRSPE